MKKAIITGATGALGTALIRELIEHDTEVLVLAREGSARNENIPKDPHVRVRYCSLDALDTLENDTDTPYDVFYHFAWEGTTGAARNDMYLQNRNVAYALDAVSAAARMGCHTFVGAGSQAEYGRVEGVLRPDTPTKPETGYGIGKLCAGLMTREVAHGQGTRHVWVRVLSVFGPCDGEQSMVMSTVRALKNGTIPKLTKGEQMWDYVYSADAASAFRLLGERGVDGKTYVLGGGKARALSDYICEIRDAVSPNAALIFGEIPYAKKQIMHLEADISALTEDTGWRPQYSFREGLDELLRSLRER